MTHVTKSDLITKITQNTSVTSADVEKVVTLMLDTITETLKAGHEVRLLGFATFAVQETKARVGRNPRTGEALQIKASKRPVFRAGKGLKDALNG
jgi:DNA-binding protein HU-beta